MNPVSVFARATVAILALVAYGGEVAAQSDQPPPIDWDRLTAVWAKHKDSMKSGHVRFHIVGGVSGLAKLTPDQVYKAVNDVMRLPEKEGFAKLCETLRPGVTPRMCELVWDGGRFHEEDLSGLGKMIQINDGINKIVSVSDGYQVSINNADAKIPRGELPTDFRWLPLKPDLFKEWEITGRFGPLVTVGAAANGTASRVTFNTETGDITATGDAINEKVIKSRYQFHWREFAKGHRLPAVKLDASFNNNGHLSFVRLSLIEDAIVDMPVRENAFVLGTVKQTNLIDRRSGKGELILPGIPATPDVVRYADQQAPLPPP